MDVSNYKGIAIVYITENVQKTLTTSWIDLLSMWEIGLTENPSSNKQVTIRVKIILTTGVA